MAETAESWSNWSLYFLWWIVTLHLLLLFELNLFSNFKLQNPPCFLDLQPCNRWPQWNCCTALCCMGRAGTRMQRDRDATIMPFKSLETSGQAVWSSVVQWPAVEDRGNDKRHRLRWHSAPQRPAQKPRGDWWGVAAAAVPSCPISRALDTDCSTATL